MAYEWIPVIFLMAFAAVYVVRWLFVLRLRRNRRIAGSLTDQKIDEIIRRRDADHDALTTSKGSLIPRVFALAACVLITVSLAVALNQLAKLPGAASSTVALVAGWVVVALCVVMCVVAFVVLIVRPFILLIRITDADQKVTEEMRSEAIARRVQAPQKPRRSWFRRTPG